MSGGPVQLMAFGYGSQLGAEEKIMDELDALQGRGLLRLLDFLFVQKTDAGDLVMLDVGDDEDYGTILAGFFPWDEDGVSPASPEVDPDELAELAAELEPGTAMALVLVEHLWAGRLFSAVEASGGELLSEGFITDEGEVILGAEVEAINDAATAIEQAHAIEAAARLEAIRAMGEAADVVDAADRIRDAAAARALTALVDAGIIEAAAAHEATDALIEAGVISAAAEQAEDDALAEAAEADAIADEAAAEADATVQRAVEIELEAVEDVQAARRDEEARERDAAETLAREVVESEIAADAARAEAEAVALAAATQEKEALDEAEQVAAAAGLREALAYEEVEATEHLAARLEAAAMLTKAERRLLNYLGTDLTFAMIADKLKISRGAVKERASRIYKKLGVHSRAEAVHAADELGVLRH